MIEAASDTGNVVAQANDIQFSSGTVTDDVAGANHAKLQVIAGLQKMGGQ